MMREGTTTFWSPNENNLSNKMRRGIHQSFKCENEEFMATQQTSSTLHYSCKDTTALTQTNKQHGFKSQNIMHSSLIQTCNTYTPTLHRSEVTTNTGNQNPPQILLFFFLIQQTLSLWTTVVHNSTVASSTSQRLPLACTSKCGHTTTQN